MTMVLYGHVDVVSDHPVLCRFLVLSVTRSVDLLLYSDSQSQQQELFYAFVVLVCPFSLRKPEGQLKADRVLMQRIENVLVALRDSFRPGHQIGPQVETSG